MQKKASAISDYATAKADPVISPNEVGRYSDHGLGRGVDMTKQTPWLCKSSFQVRPVLLENIIGTEEGGSLQSYEREIISTQDQRGEIRASIVIPQAPITIGVDAEQYRSHCSKRRSVGKKVINRTIFFRADLHDAPSSSTLDPYLARVEASFLHVESTRSRSSQQEKVTSMKDSSMSFEERLCKWILEKVDHRAQLRAMLSSVDEGVLKKGPNVATPADDKQLPSLIEGPGFTNPIETLGKFIQESTHEKRKQVVNDCKDFVYHFRITHYVSAIELGATEYQVMSEEEYEMQIGRGRSLGLEVASATAKGMVTTKRASNVKRIGFIKPDGTVERGSYGEAVVGFQIQPISNLVSIRYLQLALQRALMEYSSEEGDKASGPFIISCSNDEVYLTVNKKEDYTIEGAIDIAKASPFYINASDGSHPSEFMIVYYGEKCSGRCRKLRRGSSSLTPHLHQALHPVPRYLNAEVNTMGRNPGPLQLSMHIDESSARLVLQSRVKSRRHRTVVDNNPWVSGREVYSIRCARRRLKREGYICVKFKPGRENKPAYSTCIVPSISGHSEKNKFLLFRLLPALAKQRFLPEKESSSSEEEQRQGLDELSTQHLLNSEWPDSYHP